MKDQITARLLALGCPSVQMETTLSPAWTTDWITGPARAKLKAFRTVQAGVIENRKSTLPTAH